MSKQLEGKSCEICHAYLFEDDDIVYCPECGAPYHRDCFKAVGKCVYQEFHGTDKSYDALKAKQAEQQKYSGPKVKCGGCGRDILATAPYCPYCGRPTRTEPQRLKTPEEFFSMPQARGGVAKDKIIDQGVTADQAARTVGINSAKYLPLFVKNKKYGWNWFAFLFPAAWLGFRKMYKYCIVAVAVMILSAILAVPFYSEILAAQSAVPTNEQEIATLITVALTNAKTSAILLYCLSLLTELGLSIFTALFSTRLYRAEIISKVKKLDKLAAEKGLDAKELYLKKGGGNVFAFLAVLVIETNITYLMDLLCELL